ncbi:hypothetical protein ACFL0V_02875 [Nanoarchaeota archaeon]
MKALYIILTIFAVALLVLSLGCEKPEPEKEIRPPRVIEESPFEVVEKRGEQTNITDYQELLRRASAIESYKFNIKGTELETDYTYHILGRRILVELPAIEINSEGEEFDEVVIERVEKVALAHCEECDVDLELEKLEYDAFKFVDPYEVMSRSTKPKLIGEEMLGNDFTKVFEIQYEGEKGKIWIQEYWGFPIKLETENIRIEFVDMEIDTVRDKELETPFNFTVKGEERRWWFLDHYLGLWPKEGMDAEDFQLPA